MTRIFSTLLLVVVSLQVAFGKTVNQDAAQQAAANFCKSQGIAVSQLSLVYTATSTMNGSQVNDFYVFNNGNSGFVMISADDRVKPVLAFSSESVFSGVHMPDNLTFWVNNCKTQINQVISGSTATPAVTAQWESLTNNHPVAARSTSSVAVGPLVKTFWNQEPYYNALCPYDVTADTNAVTGCVATAMAQVMKFWQWPKKGSGVHSYASPYGMLSAEFDTTNFEWDSMPNSITAVNNAIALLMYEAGVSVDMYYGVAGSSASVFSMGGGSSTQYALPAYFGYRSSTLNAQSRYSYNNDSVWISMLEAEINAGRPFLYVGYGSDGGHCWVADGYITTSNHIHFNWGWGGYCNGYYSVDNLVPGGTYLNDNQGTLMGIMPDTGAVTGVTMVPVTGKDILIYPNPASAQITIGFGANAVSCITILDMAGRQVGKIAVDEKATWQPVNVAGYAAGDYLVQLQTTHGTITKKISVVR